MNKLQPILYNSIADMILIKRHGKETEKIFYDQQFYNRQEYLVQNIESILSLKTLMKFGNKILKSVNFKYTADTKENVS